MENHSAITVISKCYETACHALLLAQYTNVISWNNMKQTTNGKQKPSKQNKASAKYLDYLLGVSSSLDDSLTFFCLMCFLLFPLSLSLLFFFPFCFSFTASPSLSLSSSNVYVRFFLSISMASLSIARDGFSITCLRGIYNTQM